MTPSLAERLLVAAIAAASSTDDDFEHRLSGDLDAGPVTLDRIQTYLAGSPVPLLTARRLVLEGRAVEAGPAAIAWTAAERERRQEQRDAEARAEEARAKAQAKARLEHERQKAIDEEQKRLAFAGPEWVHAASALGFGATSGGVAVAQRFYIFLPERVEGKHALRCLECGAEGLIEKLPESLSHTEYCVAGHVHTPAFAAAAKA
jgi:hypothetical protein